MKSFGSSSSSARVECCRSWFFYLHFDFLICLDCAKMSSLVVRKWNRYQFNCHSCLNSFNLKWKSLVTYVKFTAWDFINFCHEFMIAKNHEKMSQVESNTFNPFIQPHFTLQCIKLSHEILKNPHYTYSTRERVVWIVNSKKMRLRFLFLFALKNLPLAPLENIIKRFFSLLLYFCILAMLMANVNPPFFTDFFKRFYCINL